MTTFRNVLLVDDDPIVRTVLRGYFQGLGVLNIQEASDGATAGHLVQALDGAFDLIVTDLSMPDEDGIQLIRRLHDYGFRGDMVIVSGRDMSIIATAQSLAKGHNLRVRGCISKPLTKGKLDEIFLTEGAQKSHANLPDLLDVASLARLFDDEAIVPYFQPKIAVRTGKIVGAEALVRAEHAQLGHLGAFPLITAARTHQMMDQLTDVMTRKALKQISVWQTQNMFLDVALNFDPQQLCALDLPDRLSGLLGELGIRPSQVIIEVTEDSLYTNLLQVMDVLARLRMKGFRTSSDDFGTGRSNIDTLQSLPFTELKLDRSFVSQALTHKFADTAIQTAVRLAKVSDLDIVAEGVETQEQLQYLTDLKVNVIQGFLFESPMPAADFERSYRENEGYAPARLFHKEHVPATLPFA